MPARLQPALPALTALVLIALAPLAEKAAAPSFDCKTANTSREEALCKDGRLAKADKALNGAYRKALTTLDSASAAALRKDQGQFIVQLDDGFDNMLAGKGAPPGTTTQSALKAAVAHRKGSALEELESEIIARTAFLRALEPQRAGYSGTWRATGATLIIHAEPGDTPDAALTLETFGWARYHCEATLELAKTGDTFSVPSVHNSDIDETYHNPISLARAGATLTLKESDGGDAFHGWSCPHIPELNLTLFAVREEKGKTRK
jgi:uncharacterized protein YecT (DUF1311 family)